jgi:DNA/RNA endonuclease YhcR with UshA esterase domain
MEIDKSKQLTILIFALATIGLVAIYISVEGIKPTETKIETIESSMIDRLVKISGRIDYIRKSKTGNFYWTVDDGTNITVPILDDKFKNLGVSNGDTVEVIGLVSEYNGEMEVMPKEIRVG